MYITRRSPWSGKKVTMKINVTATQLQAWEGGMLIQDAMPDLHDAEREFIKNGFTPSDWLDMFKDDFAEEAT